MTSKLSKYYIATLLLGTSLAASAIPAKPGLIPMTQPDGTVIEVRLVGDERSHYTLSSDGYLLTPVDNTYYYATIEADGIVKPSAIRAAAPARRSAEARAFLSQINLDEQARKMTARDAAIAATRAYDFTSTPFATRAPRQRAAEQGFTQGPGLFPGTHFPSTGKQKGLVILVEYQDLKFNLFDPHDYFSRMLNEEGFADYGATGSAADFFKESSSGLFEPEFDVYGPVTLSQKQSYYGGNSMQGDDKNPEKMAIEACQQLDDTVDFSQYDRDGDGFIDNVFIFYAGRGEASGGSPDTVWPHAWNVTAATQTPYVFDGVQLDRYACSNEWESGRPDGVGTFVHEFSHVMGLPDLYATSYTTAFTPGAWSAMDYGPYNNDGMTPPLYSAFERYALGWIDPTPITGALNATLPSIGSNICGIVSTDDPNEYFLFENRQKTSWDTYIPGHGMLVWHIQYNESVWDANTVNNSSTHQYVDIIEADNTKYDNTRGGDAFPGTTGVTSFTADGLPAFKTWSGTPIDLPITDIAETIDGVISFKVCGGHESQLPVVTALPATEVTSTSFTANWKATEGAENYLLTVLALADADTDDPDEIAGLIADGEVLMTLRSVGDVTSYTVAGLQPEKLYAYTVSCGSGLESSVPSEVMVVATGSLPFSFHTAVALPASDITETSFTARWDYLPDAETYFVTLVEKVVGDPFADLCGFDDGAKDLPEGWKSSSAAGYANSAYSGEAVPSLRLSQSSDYVLSPRYDDDISAISFWHRGAAASTKFDLLKVYVKVGGTWSALGTVTVTTEEGGLVSRFDEIPAGARQLRIEYLPLSEKSAVAIDDITISWGHHVERIPVEGFEEAVNAGEYLWFTFTGLKPGTDYSYNVYASDGELLSQTSAYVDVTTEGEKSGLAEIESASARLSIEGRCVTAHASLDIYTIEGRRVASLSAGEQAQLAPGLYIANSPDYSSKFIIF